MLLPDNKQIVLSQVGLRYDDYVALDDVSLEIGRGDFALIVGPNGGGKTSLLRIILGLLPPTRGELSFYRDGNPVASLDIGYLPQKSRIDSRFPITVSEVVAMGLLAKKLSRKEARRRLDEMLQRVELSAYASAPIGELSGGQLQRALFGRALITDPEVLVLDEPTSYIDPHFVPLMSHLLQEVNRTATVVLVSHDAAHFEPLATRLFRVHKTIEEISL